MQRFFRIAGIICLVLGGLWALQGVGLVGGSFMTGQSQWLVIGLCVAVVGAVLLGLSARKRP